MLTKILAIAWNNIYRSYTDRVSVLYMFAAPILLSTIIGLAFGSFDNDLNLPDATLKIVNLDAGYTTDDGRAVNLGQQNYVDVLVTNPPEALENLMSASLETNEKKAREQVENGELRAVLIIPPDFSEKVRQSQGEVELYYNPRSEISATVIISVVEQLTNSVNRGQVAENVYVGANGYFVQRGMATGQTDKIGEAANQALTSLYTGEAGDGITLTTATVSGEKQEFDSLRYFAPSMAILFMTFAMAGGTRSILWEQKNWLIQRIITTPTPRWVYMVGKLFGTYAVGLIQMLILLGVTPLIALMLGREGSVWGENYLGLALMTLSVVAAGTGLGLFIASISKSEQQADSIASAALILLGLLGGTFVPIEVDFISALSNISLNKWGINGFSDLANNNAPLSDVLPNIGVLVGMAGVYFTIALWRFGRKLEM